MYMYSESIDLLMYKVSETSFGLSESNCKSWISGKNSMLSSSYNDNKELFMSLFWWQFLFFLQFHGTVIADLLPWCKRTFVMVSLQQYFCIYWGQANKLFPAGYRRRRIIKAKGDFAGKTRRAYLTINSSRHLIEE